MSHIEDLLFALQQKHIALWVEDGKLRFKAPTGALTDDLRAELGQRKGEVLEFLRRKALFEQPIPKLAEGTVVPASFAQQRLLFLEQMEEQQAVYNIPAVFRCEGRLDPQRLAASLTALVERHESLRACFPLVDGQAVSGVREAYNPLRITDLRALDQADEPTRRERVEALLAEHAQQRFDLARGPLLSLHLIELGEDEQILAFNTHHIISDGWSVGVMIREWKALYDGLVLPPLPIQFNDYAAWQRQWLEQGVLASQLGYWKGQLQGLPDVLELPTDFARPALMRVQGRHLQVSLDANLGAQVRQFSQAHGATVFMTLLAAFDVLLHRWSGQDDLAVGTPIANRTHPQTEGLIGFFVNTLVLRSRFDGTASFLDVLHGVRQTALSAYAHQDLPFDYLVEQLNPTRSTGHTPLFQVMFALQNAHQETLELGGARLTLQPPAHPIAKFDLSLSVVEQDGRLDCDWEYRTDLFEPDTVAGVAGRFEQLLRGVLADPLRSVARVPMLTPADVQQLTAWAHNPLELPSNQTVVDLFEAQAARQPAHTAVVFTDQSLRYGELNARANQLAHHLIGLGAGPDTLVGLCVERSIEMIVGLLAILKAGSAYLPLDPEYPQDRLNFMLEDAGLKILLTHSALQARLPQTAGTTVCCLDRVTLDDAATGNPARRSGPRHLAYVIYTSGSTGHPKGVMIEHAALANYAQSIARQYQLTPADRVLQFSSINFDASAEEIHATLAAGACLVLRDKDMLGTEQDFLDACDHHGITVFPGPTAYWHQLVSAQVRWPERLRLVIIGGEAVSAPHVQQWLQSRREGGLTAQLVNSYGPTEATVAATACWIDQTTAPTGSASIGQPLPNARIHLLDANLEPVPPGVAGELCIAGAGLARGYLNRPDLTAEKFVEVEVFGQRERVYRSGDLARWRTDGQLEYLGRLDTQVKLRGFRIELGEIEGALMRHPAVREAVVVVHGDGDDRALAAYVTTRETAEATAAADLPAALRALLREGLPQWMVPASFTVLDALPLNPNGKVDRKALPAPERASAASAETRRLPPQTALEQQIAEIWQAVLKREQVGIDDNFFDLGGHSLLLLQVLGRLRERLGRKLPVVTLFQFPTIQSLAAHLSRSENEAAAATDRPTEATPPAATRPTTEADDGDDIAIIGMAGQFPGAANIAAFWQNLRDGVESIRVFSDEELLASGVDPQVFNRPDYVRAAGTIERPDYFDAAFFGYPPREAELLDPQQRLFMETAWTALEHAGYAVGELAFPVGVFAGAGSPTYFFNNLWPNQALRAQFGQQQLLMGGDKDFVAARAAYKLDLRGPAISLSTACSTSLVAVHVARQSLLQGECRMALAGGVTVFFPQKQGYVYQQGAILSPDGHCRAFDADAEGSVGGAGVATVVLKRLRHAREDGDTVLAVIKGSAINNDGIGRVGFTAPSVEGQSRVVRDAMRGLDFESVSYIETHGTATRLGDPIEVSALNQAYRTGTRKTGYCALGSVKTNIGHLDTAAGVTGLIKTVLALQHREIPPTLHFKQPNPQIDFDDSPFFVNAALRPWASETPRRAGVSSFGIGGTNAHVVLEEAPAQTSDAARPWQLICLSAKTETALQQYRHDLAGYLVRHPDVNLADVAHTFHVGRARFAHRGFIVARDAAELVAQLGQEKSRHWQRGRVDGARARVAFMFPGQGSQYPGMGRGLYEQKAVFRDAVDECARLLRPHLQLDIRTLIYPEATADAAAALKGSQAAQPALFTVAYALARLCLSWGIEPVAMIGHSIGEYVAACLAGVFSLADALELVAVRGRLMQEVPAGEMLGVMLPHEEVAALLPDGVHVAAHNAPRLTSVSGSPDAIGQLVALLQERRILFTRLQTLNAAHSPVMAPVLEPLRTHLNTVRLNPPQRPFVSNLTGTWITPEQATSADYWCAHLRQPVRFTEGLQALAAQGTDLLLEVGPEMVLTSFAQQHRPQLKLTALNLLRSAASTQDDRAWVLGALGQLWLKGVAIDWAALRGAERRLRLPLPTYPFERQRYWIEPVQQLPVTAGTAAASATAQAQVMPAGGSCTVTCLPSGNRPDLPTDYLAPVTPTQQQLASIWQNLLGVEPIGLHDDFFRLGGNSLLGLQVLSRLREAFAVEIPLNTLFVHPVLEDLAAWLDSQSGQGQTPVTVPPIRPQAADEPLVMSFSQQRLRFLAQMEEGDSATYNLPGVVHLTGRLDEVALREAFVALVRRHDSLRLSFPLVAGEVVVRKGKVYDPVVIDDLRDRSADERQVLSRAWMTRHAQAPFDLSTGPLLRLNVLLLAEQEHLLLVNMHHIISDGWTIGLLIHEWCQLYNGLVRGEPAVLPALAIQYTDYAAWQRQWLQGEVLVRQMDYWGTKLAGAPELLELPTDFPRPAMTSYQGAHQRLVLPAALAQRLEAFGQANGATLFMTLMAAFKVLLYRYSGQTDLLVGTPVANRTQRDTEHVVGFFVNTLVLRDVLEPQGDFLQWLQQVKQTELEAHDHQDLPFDHLVEHLNPVRSLSHAPLFQVMFALQNAPSHGLVLDGLQAALLESDVRTSKFDLTLSVEARGEALACDWEYSTDLFRSETIARMHAHLQALLEGIVADPRQAVARLPMLTDADRAQLLAWNQTEVAYPGELTVVDLFEQQVDRTPDAPAAVFEGATLSYAELDARANQVAHALVTHGVGPDTLVGLCVPRSLEMVIGLLGVLKAGGAYVPLDPDYPEERLRFMVEDAQAAVLLTHSAVPALSASATVALQLDDTAAWATFSDARPARSLSPQDLAYVIYTSGSTGRPKGVMLAHTGAANLALAQRQMLDVGPDSAVLQFASLSFDAATWEALMALSTGAALHLAPSQRLREDLLAVLRDQAITHATLPPSMVAVLPPEALPALRTLVVAGEACSPALLTHWASGRRFVNAYGPTEATVCATVSVCTPEMRHAPIGTPIANTRLYVVDDAFQVLPPGVPGELCIAGVGLARGYLNRPELTAEKFITAEVLGRTERLYRTGDLVRWAADGQLDYLGRIDQQVKLRGFRIELGEIESALTAHAAVSTATVVLREREGQKALAGYVVLRAAVQPDALKTWLQARLPDYMVPATLTVLDALPMTPNGKVDRKALPEPAMALSSGRALRGPTEELLGVIWAEMLGLGDAALSAESHFFELGGHSLLAARTATRIRAGLGVDCPLRALFERPVLADLAAWLDAQQRGTALEAITPLAEGEPQVLSPAQQRLWFLAQLEGPSSTYNMPAALRLTGALDEAALRASLLALTARQASLRQHFPVEAGQARLHERAPWDPLELVDLQSLDAAAKVAEVERLGHAYAQAPFDLAQGPLFRACLLRLAGDAHVLLINLHHSIADGWSIAVLVREWGVLYDACCRGTEPTLAPLPVAYRDVAAWQQRWNLGPAAAEQLAWWTAQLRGAPALLELPTDFPRPARQRYRGTSFARTLDPALSQAVAALARSQGATVFMTLMAALQVVLQRHSGQDDLSVGTPVANRGHGSTEHLIGLFVNTLVIRSRIDPQQPFTALLGQVRQTSLGAFVRQELPFDRLVEALQPGRSLAHAPLFQVLFVLQNNEQADTRLAGLQVTPVAQTSSVAKFDLTLNVLETPEGLVCDWEFATDLFTPARIERLAAHFEQVLREVTRQPDTPVRDIDLLTQADRAQLLAWNQTDSAHPRNLTLVDLFERQVDATPDATAVVFDGASLSYAELERRSNRIAHGLVAQGVRADALVGLCMPRSLEMVTGLLGILKAGGAYVPLDPAYPPDRLAAMVEDSQAAVVLTHAEVEQRLPDGAARRLLIDEPASWQVWPNTRLPRRAAPTDLAYVLFTSGSTGRAKGVAIEHRSTATFLFWVRDHFEPSLLQGMLASTSINFDLSVFELFGPLCFGGRVLLARNALHLPEMACRDEVTLINTVPSAMAELVRSGQVPASVRVVNLAGEALQNALVQQIYALPHIEAVNNLYGPSEDTTYSTWTTTVRGASSEPTIGRPLPDTRVYIVDRHLDPLPPGVPGELCIAGAGLARGYLDRPELTAEKFIQREVLGRAERLYRTGDLVRWNAQGELEYLGRLDHQIKLRGFRIELGEIESALNAHAAVSSAVVVLHERDGVKALAGYVVPSALVQPAELKGWLGTRLPDYMVPASITLLDAMPLNPNGKIDRKALPEPLLAGSGVASGSTQALQTPVEQLLCALWSQVLKQDITDTQSHFFDIGGHSLLATQLVSRIREGFGVAMPLQTVFEQPVLAQQARWLEQQQRGQTAAVTPLVPAGDGPRVMSYAQQRLWFLSHLEGQNAAYNMPLGLRLRGVLDEAALRQATRALVERHESLRLCFPEVDGRGTVQCLPAYDPLSQEDLSALPEADRQQQLDARLARHGRAAFDLDVGPLFALHLLKLDAHDHVLLFNMHHIISDGWSMGVIVRDWSALYDAACQQQAPVLPALSIQYTDYAAWQKRWLSGPALQEQLGYWRDTLAEAPELLELPTDFSRPAVKTYQGRHLGSVLPADLGADIRRLCREQGVTPYMALLAAFKVLLYRYSGQTDLLVGSPIANRTQGQTEDLIGFFVNTLVMRSRLDEGESFEALLRQVRRTALGAYSHQDIPFEYLVEKLNPARSTSHSPLFQVMFIMQNTPMGALSFGETEVSVLETELTTAKFDLTLSMTERDGAFLCDWEYATDLFEAESVRRMAGHFEALLRQLVQAPQQPYARFSLLTPAEARELQDWNHTAFDYPRTQTLVDQFEAQAAHRPGEVAARFGDEALTYTELDQRANRLAHHLIDLGVGPDVLVGLCVERSLDMLVGLLGILKAGGAYVPMDPEYPRERLQMMREDAAMPVLLTQAHLCPLLSPGEAAVVCLDRDAEAIAQQSAETLPRRSGPGDLAYVIFTSGSTGRPKGVMIGHGALLNFLGYMQQRLGVQPHDRLLALTTLSFDIAGLELWLPLVSGSQVVIVSRETAMDGERLMQEMAERQITVMQATPATWKLLLQSAWQQATPLTILCGGEAMPNELGRKLLANSQQLWNVYGPTETTIWSSMQDVTRQPGRPQLIGQPIGNTLVHILDAQGCVVPPGMPGELCIGGDGLARGYLGRPDLTAERFIEIDLFGEYTTLYRTGDLARWLRNGTLECLGRIDHQVKVRGFRIELGEVEEVLNQHPRVRESAVITDATRESLLAYVVPQDEASFEDAAPEGREDQIRHWEQVWSDAYSQSGDDIEDRQRNAIGWNSSYTLEPIPEAEMKDWLDATIEPILALAPKRVLEIGCGTGMLLFRLAPHCAHYTGADISAQALHWIEQQKAGWDFGDRVTLLHAAADRIEGVEPGSVDLVIINSVIQYFPSVDYLVEVLSRAVALLAPGGRIFVGDVRNLQWMEAFHASIQLFQAQDGLSVKELQQRVRASLARERELLVDPAFFTALRQHLPAITGVDVQLRRGVAHNEMSCFRVDVTLQVGGAAAAVRAQPPVRRLDWAGDGLTLAQLGQRLAELQANVVEIECIPNARLATEQQVLERLDHFDGTVADLKQQVDVLGDEWVDPATLRALAREASWHCALHHADRFHYTAVLQRVVPGTDTPAPILPRAMAEASTAAPRSWRSYANTPAFDILDRTALVAMLREHLQQRLPAYMVPASFTVLDRLPLTPNGKIDRKALPAPDSQRRDTTHHAPRDTVELQLVQIWEDLLKVRPVGIRDPFFELGGHSLLAVRMVAQIAQVFGQRLSLTTLFHHTTIESLATVLRQRTDARPWSCRVPIQPAGQATPLFLVHPAGGNVLCYLELAQQLGTDQPVHAFQAEGLEDGQTPSTEVAEMARTYLHAMKEVQPHGPYQLAGWSFGGLVAAEMAAQLQARHESVSFLGMLDAIAPQVIRDLTPEPEDDAQFFADYFAASDATLDLDHLRRLDPQAQLDHVVEQGRQLGIFPADVEVEQTQRLVRTYRSNMAAALRHHPKPLSVAITLFQATERRPEDPALPADHGWRACTTGPVEVVVVPGQHHTMVSRPHVEVLAQRLKAGLELRQRTARLPAPDVVPA